MMNKVCRTVVFVFGVSLFMVNSSFGQSGNRPERKEPPTFEELLKKMDADEDGQLSAKEVKGPLKEHFSKIDANEDGFLTEKELEEAPKPKHKN
ncbi:EF-hand domain-containing protein [Tamlana agarivorans]|uniref:EF-hand domain-containing protein n=1 Tax=Pseudotamlana agarivorans TaxID=481183 RepID=A0ACC5U710_9FLAO|nr:EF-hand domain-containing protein [Tamlana agarivorans]MBU2950084.1 EF-hand domain-containing protein [Tamlana agarivorans]